MIAFSYGVYKWKNEKISTTLSPSEDLHMIEILKSAIFVQYNTYVHTVIS